MDHNSSDVTNTAMNRFFTHTHMQRLCQIGLSMGYIGYPLWLAETISAKLYHAGWFWFHPVAFGGQKNYARTDTVIPQIFLSRKSSLLPVESQLCGILTRWLLPSDCGFTFLPSAAPVVVLVGSSVQTDTNWSCILGVYSVWTRLNSESV